MGYLSGSRTAFPKDNLEEIRVRLTLLPWRQNRPSYRFELCREVVSGGVRLEREYPPQGPDIAARHTLAASEAGVVFGVDQM